LPGLLALQAVVGQAAFAADAPTVTSLAPAAGAAGTVDVRVVTSAGLSDTTPADQYTYQPAAPACTTTTTGTNNKQLTVTSGLTAW
jgi:hypothetical protein